MAKITIKGPASSRSDVSARTGKPYTIISQPAVLETASIRTPFDLDLPSLDAQKEVGSEWNWDVEESLKIGRYGPELPRFMPLVSASQPARRGA